MTLHPTLQWRSPCGTYAVDITRRCYRTILRMALEHLPNEVGTSLVGTYSADGHKATVNGISHLPDDSRATRTSFQRGINGLAKFFTKVFVRFHGRRHYVGEWHSHPYSSPMASATDDSNQAAIAHDVACDCPEAILVIVGGDAVRDIRLQVYVYSRTRGKVVLEPA